MSRTIKNGHLLRCTRSPRSNDRMGIASLHPSYNLRGWGACPERQPKDRFLARLASEPFLIVLQAEILQESGGQKATGNSIGLLLPPHPFRLTPSSSRIFVRVASGTILTGVSGRLKEVHLRLRGLASRLSALELARGSRRETRSRSRLIPPKWPGALHPFENAPERSL